METSSTDVLNFWFTECTPQQWFKKDAKFDALLKDRFGVSVDAALDGDLDLNSASIDDCLATILLLDQFARNIYRDTPRAFAGDAKALKYSQHCVAHGAMDRPNDNHRTFILMPMMHSEDLVVQDASLPLFESYTKSNSYIYAVKHRDIIERFGRFPHRNAILGRASTNAEIEFLTQPGSSF
jgi:uncharacterized protein (DUF924 family)